MSKAADSKPKPNNSKYLVFITGFILLLIILYMVRGGYVVDAEGQIVKTILSVAVAAFATFITGQISMDLGILHFPVKAGGPIAVFAICFYVLVYNPSIEKIEALAANGGLEPTEVKQTIIPQLFCARNSSLPSSSNGDCITDYTGNPLTDPIILNPGEINERLIPVNPNLIPPGARISELVDVSGSTNRFSGFTEFKASYSLGNIKIFAKPNEFGGFTEKVLFTLKYTE